MYSPDEISRIRKRNFKRAVDPLRRDDVDALKRVLDVLPEFNTMVGRNDRNLLHLSCRFERKKVFDYLLNLNCFDLEAVDDFGYSTLHIAITNISVCDYFIVKLINAGVDVFKICHEKTYLHFAINRYLLETAKLLLQKGVDPNAQEYFGDTALHLLLNYRISHKADQGMDLLLEYGADTAICNKFGYLPFDCAVTNGRELSIQEHLFYCTFDSHSAGYEMSSVVFNRLLDNVSPLLDNVMDVLSDVIFKEHFPVNFFKIPPDLLKKFIERYGSIIRRGFSIIKPDGDMEMNTNCVEILLNSELHFETVELISKLDLWRIYSHNYLKEGKEKASSLIFYLLSYGLNVTSYDCDYIYESEGHSDLFKTMLLLLDYTDTSQTGLSMVRIIVDIHFDLNTFLRFNRRFPCKIEPLLDYFANRRLPCKIEPLLDYFANPELKLFCESLGNRDLINKVRQLPAVPSLLQLARDETKRHIVRRYNLQKTSQYYWVLRRLLGDTDYAEILSFETKLYG